jgi:hypothetical protein
MMIMETQNLVPIKSVNEFYKKREDFLKSDIPTDYLLL